MPRHKSDLPTIAMLSNYYTDKQVECVNKWTEFLVMAFVISMSMNVVVVKTLDLPATHYVLGLIFNSTYTAFTKAILFMIVLILYYTVLALVFGSIFVLIVKFNNKYSSVQHTKIKICVVIPSIFFVFQKIVEYSYYLEVTSKKGLRE